MKPIIGITPSAQTDMLAHGTFRRYVLSSPYVRAVEAAGGIPLILPPQGGNVESLTQVIDGLLLSGGADINPVRYGESSIHPETYGIDDERDRFELDLFDAMLQREKPVFGICRGIQVINVALGGTLIQDIASQHPGAAAVGHRQHERGLEDSAIGHVVSVTESDVLPIFGNGQAGVNSFHHQAIRDLAPALFPAAYSPDGLVEAVAMAERPSVFAVQWHPELMYERHQEHLRGFMRLVDAAAARNLVTHAV
jgi:putative glutamine amidotransferase